MYVEPVIASARVGVPDNIDPPTTALDSPQASPGRDGRAAGWLSPALANASRIRCRLTIALDMGRQTLESADNQRVNSAHTPNL